MFEDASGNTYPEFIILNSTIRLVNQIYFQPSYRMAVLLPCGFRSELQLYT